MPDQPKVTKPALDIPVPSTTDNENILASKKSGEANPLIFFDINVGPEFLGRLIIELYKDVAPKTCENFRQLANGTAKGRTGQQLHYKNSIFHRVINRFMIQGNVFMANTNLIFTGLWRDTYIVMMTQVETLRMLTGPEGRASTGRSLRTRTSF